MHALVLASRIEPPLPLARLRVREELFEVRTQDLRFTSAETTLFFTHTADHLHLSPHQLQLVEARTEGWVAELELVALSLRGQDSYDTALTAFTGNTRHVLDYLVEEILSQQPAQTQAFLLYTSLVERLTGSLCDALTGQHDGQEMLEHLEAANLFLLPLDSQRSWYRYHRLFAEAMQQKLRRQQPETLPALYLKASCWYEQQGWMTDAVETALAGQQFERAAHLIESTKKTMIQCGETATLLRWVQELPTTLVSSHITLCLLSAWLFYLTVQFTPAERTLSLAETLLAAQMDASLQREVAAEISALRAVMAVSRHDTFHAIEFASSALHQLSKEKRLERALVTWALGVAYWFNDDIQAASRALTESIALGQALDSPYTVLTAYGDLVQVCFAQGHLRQAAHTLQQGQLFVQRSQDRLPAPQSLSLARGELQRERNELEDALHLLTHGLEHDQQIWDVGSALRGYISLARTEQALGNISGAFHAIQQAEHLSTQRSLPHVVALVRAYQTRLWVMQGAMLEARQWEMDSGLCADDALHHTREVEYLTLDASTWLKAE